MRTGLQPRSTSSPRSSGKVLKKLLFVLLAVIGLFEIVPRVVDVPGLEPEVLNPAYVASQDGKAFVPHPYLIFTPKPGYERTAASGKQFSHSPSGFRGAEIPLAKTPGAVRIACVGGSSTYGTGPKSDAAAWPAQLVNQLGGLDGGRTIEVLNAGVPSWNSFECLANLEFRVLPYAPDVVLIYLGTNDAECALWPGVTADNSHYRMTWATFRPSPLESKLERSIIYLAWRKYFTDYLDQRADLGFTGKIVPEGKAGELVTQYKSPVAPDAIPGQGFANFQRNLVSMIAVIEAHGATPVLITQALWSPAPESDHLLHGAARIAAQSRMTDVVRSVAAERGVPIVEMKTFMEGLVAEEESLGMAQTLFTNNVHLTDAGAARFADRLASELVRIGAVK